MCLILFDFVLGGLGCSCCLRLFPTILSCSFLFVDFFNCSKLFLFSVVLCQVVFGGLKMFNVFRCFSLF